MDGRVYVAGSFVVAGALAAILVARRKGDSVTVDHAVPKAAPIVDTSAARAWAAPTQYAPSIRAAELQNDIPRGLLERQLYQESRYRADIISGAVVSSAGAIGIAQIIPRWHPEANPTDAIHSIQYAAKYLRQLYGQFGRDWRKALAAYNWGPGNLSRVNHNIPLWLSQTPPETRNYVTEITRDVPV